MRNADDPTAQVHSTRCWLVAWSTAGGASYADAKTGTFEPDLAIDVSSDVISVVDLQTNALVASAPLAQTTATPATRMGGTYERRYARKGMPVLVVNVPGAGRLTIGCIEPSRSRLPKYGYQYSWRGTVEQETDPAYLVADAGWRTLVDRFGLAAQLRGWTSRPLAEQSRNSNIDSAPPPLYVKPRYASAFQRLTIAYLAFCIAFLVALLIIATVFHQW